MSVLGKYRLKGTPSMKNFAISLLAATLLLSTGVVFTGCEEEATDASTMRKARLVADENIELKRQLAEKDKEIEKQKQLVEQCKQEMSKAQEDSGTAMLQMLQHLAESAKEVEALTQENSKLKERIAELEAKLATPRSEP
jgi:hypothetical protein